MNRRDLLKLFGLGAVAVVAPTLVLPEPEHMAYDGAALEFGWLAHSPKMAEWQAMFARYAQRDFANEYRFCSPRLVKSDAAAIDAVVRRAWLGTTEDA